MKPFTLEALKARRPSPEHPVTIMVAHYNRGPGAEPVTRVTDSGIYRVCTSARRAAIVSRPIAICETEAEADEIEAAVATERGTYLQLAEAAETAALLAKDALAALAAARRAAVDARIGASST